MRLITLSAIRPAHLYPALAGLGVDGLGVVVEVSVNASDGPIGRIHGFVVDPSDHQVTHVLLDEGHLWGKKEVCVPTSSVTGIDDDGVQLSLSKKEVGELPPVDIEHPRRLPRARSFQSLHARFANL